MSREAELRCVIADLCEQLRERDAELNSFRSAVAHVTEDGKTKRSFSTGEGWAMVHKDRLLDLEILEEAADKEHTK